MGLLDDNSAGAGSDWMNSDQFRLGLGLLAAAGPRADHAGFGQRLAEGFGYMQSQRDEALKREMMKLQFQQAARKNDLINNFISGSMGPSQAGGDAPGGAVTQGGASMQPQDSGVAPSAGPSGSGLGGIPRSAIVSDLAFNDGKNLGEWAFKRGTPNWQNINGNLVDTNAPGFRGGFQPGVQTSANGQVTMWQPDGKGGVVVGAPNGAIDTYSAYLNAGKQAENQNTLVPLDRVDPATGRPYTGTVADLIKAQPSVGKSQPVANIGNAALSPELKQLIQRDAQANGIPNPVANFNAPGGGVAQLSPAAGGQPAGFNGFKSATEQEVDKARALDPVNATAAFNKGRADQMVQYENGLNSRVQQGADLNMRMGESLNAMENFKGGGGQESRAHLGSIAQAMGASPKVVNGIAGGDLASMQEFNKLAVQQAMEQLKQSMGGAGRIAQAEFKVFQANNPNLSTDDNAIRKIYDFNTRVFNRDLAEQKAFNAHVDSGANPASFPMLWQSKQTQQGFTNPSLNAQNPAPAGQYSITAPNGKTYKFADANALANFKLSNGIK